MEIAIYVKNLIEPLLFKLLRDWNNIHEIAMIISGGSALEAHFNKRPELVSVDFDIKVVSRDSFNLKESYDAVKEFIRLVQLYVINEEIVGEINKSMAKIFNKTVKFEVETVEGNYLSSVLLKFIDPYTKKETGEVYAFIDIFIVSPHDIYHYNTFIPYEGNTNILTESNLGDFYIPVISIDGVLFATLGYVIWDTVRMLTKTHYNSSAGKRQRYLNKWYAIIAALNNVSRDLSCEANKEFVEKCSREDCTIEKIERLYDSALTIYTKKYLDYIRWIIGDDVKFCKFLEKI
jgi:hypothetical protein